MASIQQLVGPAIHVARANGMTEEEGLRIAGEVRALFYASISSGQDSPEDDRFVDLITNGILTEVHDHLALDLAFIGMLVERGYIRGGGVTGV